MPKYLNVDRKIIKIDIERLGSLVINLAQHENLRESRKLYNVKRFEKIGFIGYKFGAA